MKAGVARARIEGKHIGRPFREINWRKVNEYRAKGLSRSAVSRVMDIPYNMLLAAKARRAERRIEILRQLSAVASEYVLMSYLSQQCA
jgi:hypothetical protein